MARMRVGGLYRGDGARVKYGCGGIMSAVTKEILTRGVPDAYSEQTWLEALNVRYMLVAVDRMKTESGSVSAMTDVEALSLYGEG